MMVVTIINGSPRKNGATGKILREFEAQLAGNGSMEVHYINLADYSLIPCSGCGNCYKTGVCHLEDDAEEINRLIASSQGVIVGSPTYVSNVSGLLKNYIDRGHIVVEQSLKGKYMFAVSTYEIAGGTNVISILNTMFRYAGGIPAGKYLLRLDHNSNPLEQENVLKRIKKKADRFRQIMERNKSKSLLDRLINFVVLSVVIKPFVTRHPTRYQAVLQRWKEIGISG